MMKLLAALIAMLTVTGPVFARLPGAAPEIIALIASETADGSVMIDGATGFFAVATTTVGNAGRVRIVPETDTLPETLRISVCETERSTGACLDRPRSSLSLATQDGEPRSFGVFLRAVDPATPLGNIEVTLAFIAEDGRQLGRATATVVHQPQPPDFEVPWLMWLVAGSLAYAVILGINRIVFNPLQTRRT